MTAFHLTRPLSADGAPRPGLRHGDTSTPLPPNGNYGPRDSELLKPITELPQYRITACVR
ncbi:hypothetical protein ABZS96_25930 [Streptomyces avermitilis]|uniref:hypothetical protein n=1 Tax=Streptomyces avermitilis TaxID=33903 RepID=UPI0033BE9BA0